MMQVDIAFDPKELAEFEATLERFQKATGKSQKEVVRWGTIAVCKSLRASTKRSRERRKVYLPKTKKEKDMRDKDGKSVFYVQKFFAGKETFVRVWGHSKKQVEKHYRITEIYYRGTAQKSWGWAMMKLFGRGDNATNTRPRARHVLDERVIARKYENAGEVGISIDNNLSYIRKAFRTKGESAVTTALARATRGMKKRVEDEMTKQGF